MIARRDFLESNEAAEEARYSATESSFFSSKMKSSSWQFQVATQSTVVQGVKAMMNSEAVAVEKKTRKGRQRYPRQRNLCCIYLNNH